MLPIRDHNPTHRFPSITWALIAINVAVQLGMTLFAHDVMDAQSIYLRYGMVPLRLSYAEGLPSLVTHMFLHDGWLHLGGNMLFLWIFGDNLEDQMGRRNFLIFYLVGGALAAMVQFIGDPSSPVPMVGASGAVAAVMGGYMLLFPKAKVDIFIFLIIIFKILPVPAWLVLGAWAGFQILNGMAQSIDASGVAYWAHIGGFAAGLLLIVPTWRRKGGSAFWARTHGHPPHAPVQYRASPLPRVDKKR